MNCVTGLDIGISNGDCVHKERYISIPRQPDALDTVKSLLQLLDVEPDAPIAITGVGSRFLPDRIAGHQLLSVPEFQAVGRGGQLLSQNHDECLVLSAGSGIALVHARGGEYVHKGGTGCGGGTLVGLARLLLDFDGDAQELAQLASAGDAAAVNLRIDDVFGGALGSLPAEFTAVNFGKLIDMGQEARAKQLAAGDVAAGLTVLVAEVAAVLASAVAKALGVGQLVVVGNLVRNDVWVSSLRRIVVGFGLQLHIPDEPGSAVARGALDMCSAAVPSK